MLRKGFTLIELLIVVAIIAILAAIAVPNFLEAQTRAKVSRAKADIRTCATALESYSVDNNHFPFDITSAASGGLRPGVSYYWYISNLLSTPISYLSTNKLIDPFRDKKTGALDVNIYGRFRYVAYEWKDLNQAGGAFASLPGAPAAYDEGLTIFGSWRLLSSGPDSTAGPWSPVSSWPGNANGFPSVLLIYDATNGTISPGDIVRSHKQGEQRQTPYTP